MQQMRWPVEKIDSFKIYHTLPLPSNDRLEVWKTFPGADHSKETDLFILHYAAFRRDADGKDIAPRKMLRRKNAVKRQKRRTPADGLVHLPAPFFKY